MPESARQLAKRLCEEIQKKGKDRGLLIAFEGPDGSGKTTQRKLFKEWLAGEGYDVVTTKWSSSRLVKPIIKTRKNMRSINPEEFCLDRKSTRLNSSHRCISYAVFCLK